jgi:hypothetical protein
MFNDGTAKAVQGDLWWPNFLHFLCPIRIGRVKEQGGGEGVEEKGGKGDEESS